LLGHYQPLARQRFVLFLDEAGPAGSHLLAFSRMGTEFLGLWRQLGRHEKSIYIRPGRDDQRLHGINSKPIVCGIGEKSIGQRCGLEDAICNDARGVMKLTSSSIPQLISERFRTLNRGLIAELGRGSGHQPGTLGIAVVPLGFAER
jgi:hypothetical protein